MAKEKRMNPERRKLVDELLKLPLWEGFVRTVYLCKACGQVQAHDYIPYGLGRGVQRNPCLCSCVSGNWIHYSAQEVGRREVSKRR